MNRLLLWIDQVLSALLDACSDHNEPPAQQEPAKARASHLASQVDPADAFVATWGNQLRPWYVSINPDGQPVVLEERVYVYGQEALSKLVMRTPWVRIRAGSKEEAEAVTLFLLTDDPTATCPITWGADLAVKVPRSSDMGDTAEATLNDKSATVLQFRARSTQWKEHG